MKKIRVPLFVLITASIIASDQRKPPSVPIHKSEEEGGSLGPSITYTCGDTYCSWFKENNTYRVVEARFVLVKVANGFLEESDSIAERDPVKARRKYKYLENLYDEQQKAATQAALKEGNLLLDVLSNIVCEYLS